tara:strand:- start:1037 stop:1306 length:270 start_codon:yes stop_codon:yes gene_type:complete
MKISDGIFDDKRIPNIFEYEDVCKVDNIDFGLSKVRYVNKLILVWLKCEWPIVLSTLFNYNVRIIFNSVIHTTLSEYTFVSQNRLIINL